VTLPPAAHRLSPGYEESLLTAPAGRGLLLARVLEDGDRADLRWLFATVPEDELRAWLLGDGRRQLSRRSYALWRLHFALPSPVATGDNPFWPEHG
jgi:hypothetical protein